jgi:hypothetical protein
MVAAIGREHDSQAWYESGTHGRPVYSCSIFVDGVCPKLFPQMDVWPRC